MDQPYREITEENLTQQRKNINRAHTHIRILERGPITVLCAFDTRVNLTRHQVGGSRNQEENIERFGFEEKESEGSVMDPICGSSGARGK